MFKALHRHIRKLFKKPKVDSRVTQQAIKHMNLKNEYKHGVIFASCSFISHHAYLNSAINRN